MGFQAHHHPGMRRFLAIPARSMVHEIAAAGGTILPSPIRRTLGRHPPMQRYQRNRHRLIWLFVAPAALALLVFAIWNRPEWPEMKSLPTAESSPNPSE